MRIKRISRACFMFDWLVLEVVVVFVLEAEARSQETMPPLRFSSGIPCQAFVDQGIVSPKILYHTGPCSDSTIQFTFGIRDSVFIRARRPQNPVLPIAVTRIEVVRDLLARFASSHLALQRMMENVLLTETPSGVKAD